MILKFTHIKNVGRYVKFECVGDQTLRKLNLFFGENGRGKTTIAAILRSLSSGDPNYIKERKTLGSDSAEDIEVLLNTGTAKFNGVAWNLLHDGILIFDHRFIRDNIHVGESVEINNKRNLAGVILGEKGVEISKQIKDQDELARAKLDEYKTLARQIKIGIPASMTVEAYVALPVDSEVDKKIKAKSREMDAEKRAASINAQPLLKELPVPGLPSSFAATLSETIITISSTAEAKVRAHLSAEHMKDAEGWLSEGMDFMTGPTCPVCGQSTEKIDIFSAYKDYFSEEYARLRDRVTKLDGVVVASIGTGFAEIYERTALANAAPFEFWKELLSITLPATPNLESIKAATRTLENDALTLLAQKKASILEEAQIGALANPLQLLQPSISAVNEYNVAVSKVNEAITALKTKQSSTPLSILESDMGRLRAIKARHTEAAVAQIALLESTQRGRDAAIAAKDKAQKALTEYSKEIVISYEERINEILTDFGAGFRISGVETEFPAGTPASNYQIVINGRAIDAGKIQADSPSFQSMLSGGDKSTLALAFFFASLEQNANKATKVVFLDDPFTSQDEHRRTQTGKLIHKAVAECAQVIVSSHEPSFLRMLWEKLLAPGDCKSLKLTRDGADETTIVEWNIEHETKHPFLRLHDELTLYAAGTLTLRSAEVIQKLRPLIEEYLRFRFPNTFNRRAWLVTMIRNFEEAGTLHPMHDQLTDLRAINDYTSPTHHQSIEINDTELLTHVKKALKIVGKT